MSVYFLALCDSIMHDVCICVCVCVYMPTHVWVIVKFFIFFGLSRPDSTWNDARMIFFFYFLLKNFGNAPAHLGRNDTEMKFFVSLFRYDGLSWSDPL